MSLGNVFKAILVVVGLTISYILGVMLNQLVIIAVTTIFGTGYEAYLWIQYHVMGFAVFYTIYIMLILVYIYKIPSIIKLQYKILKDGDLPKITIVIPAYNEEGRIGEALEHLLSIDYPRDKLEIIVVDDGSSDNTSGIAESYGVKVIKHMKNMGRGAAVKTGILNASGELIVTIDADTKPMRDSIRKLVSYMVQNRSIGAACGRLIPHRAEGLLGIGQRVEYALGYAYTKSLKSSIGWMLIPSGAFSIYRRSLVIDAAAEETIAEDFDMGLHIIEKGYRLGYLWDATAYTEIPLTLSSYIRQRVRWNVGGLQVMAKHWYMMFNPRYNDIGLIALPFHLIIGFATMLMEIYGLFFLLLLHLTGVIPLFNFAVLATWLILLKIFTMILLFPGYIYARIVLGERIGLHHLVIYWIAYYYLLLYTAVKGILTYLEYGRTGW